MTLKEKFKKQLDTATPKLNRPWYQANQCEQIADDYAVEFANYYEEVLASGDFILFDKDKKKLLEKFKKEKGL